MIKFFRAAIVATAFAAQSAQAGDCCCSDHGAAAPAEKSADHQAKGADQNQQAQANDQNRSFSYEPAPAGSQGSCYSRRSRRLHYKQLIFSSKTEN